MQGLVLSDDPLILVARVDDLRDAAQQGAYLVVGDDHQLVQGREEPPVGGLRAVPAVWGVCLLSVRQVGFEAFAGVAERLAQEADVTGGELEGYGSAATRRVWISHEECTLLVVSPPVGVCAPPGGVCLLWRFAA